LEEVTGILAALSGLTPPPPSFPRDFTLGDLELPPSSARRFSFSLVEDFDLGFRDRNISDNFFSLVCDIAPCVGNEGWGVAAAEEEEEEEEGSAV